MVKAWAEAGKRALRTAPATVGRERAAKRCALSATIARGHMGVTSGTTAVCPKSQSVSSASSSQRISNRHHTSPFSAR